MVELVVNKQNLSTKGIFAILWNVQALEHQAR